MEARRQALYDSPDMIWNQGGSHPILFTDEQVPEELKVMMNLNKPFDVYMTCQYVVVHVRAFMMMGMRRPNENFDRFQMCLLHDGDEEEKLAHWFSSNELGQLTLINMNSLLNSGQIQPWMQCNNAVTKSAHQAPSLTSSDSDGGAASSGVGAASSGVGAASGGVGAASGGVGAASGGVGAASGGVGAASAAPIAAPGLVASQPDVLARVQASKDRLAALIALQKKA